MAEGALQFNVAAVVEDVLQQHGKRLNDLDLASRKAEESSLKRYDVAGWLRKMVGVVGGRDLPAQPSEEEFRLGLRSGIILCNVLNKVQPGTVPKVIEAPADTVAIPDGAALSAYQYFENVRNFLDAIEEMGIPTFEASDLEQGGKSSRIVNCILALKSYHDWKQGGGTGVWKFGGNLKPASAGKQFVRKNSELFLNSISRSSSVGEKCIDSLSDQNSCSDEVGASHSLQILVRELLSDKDREDIPVVVENMLSKVMEEFERRLTGQNEQIRIVLKENGGPASDNPPTANTSGEMETTSDIVKENTWTDCQACDAKSKNQSLIEFQHRNIQELKYTLCSTKEDMKMFRMKYQEEVENLGKQLQSLAHAASGYQKVLEENRKLYNQVQDLRGNIRVYCRVRPFLPGQPNNLSTVDDIGERTIAILTPSNAPSKFGKGGRKTFTFNKVFGPSASQEEVFADTQPLVRSVLDGYNVCIFAYGQTGSGKTHTMTGPKELTNETLGVNYRALSDLFLISEQRKDTISYDVSVQMIEIYNEQVRDLLCTDGLNKRLEIRNHSQNGVNVPSANIVSVASTSDVINLMNLGQKNRAVSATAMNDRSSRSHSCLTVHVIGKDITSGTVLHGCMHLVDLAGSERADKSEAVGDRLKEAQHINKSLSALGDVISSLASKNSHVPYRNSKLTQLLQDSLGGQAKTLMFVHISPEPDALGETLSTLKFAERVSTVELGAAKANKESADVKELKEQIASLKAALARKGGEYASMYNSTSSSPDRLGALSSGSSPSRSSLLSAGDFNKSERQSNSSLSSRRQSFDIQDMLMNSPPRPPISSPVGSMEDEKCGDWVDRVMVNKPEDLQLPENFYQKHSNADANNSKIYPEQSLNKKKLSRRHSLDNAATRNNQFETAATDESDDLEAATSDSSEPEWQFNIPRSNSAQNGWSKIRRPGPKQRKSPERRSQIPQPPSRKLSNGMQSPMHNKHARQSAADGRRKPASGK